MSPSEPVALLTPGRYRRGHESRERILAVALQAFSLKGLNGVSTRDIAAAAGVNLPAIQYYFGGKDGLYLACAQHIVTRYVAHNLESSRAAVLALDARCTPDAARAHLGQVLGTLARFLLDSDEAPGWSLFVQRELADPGPVSDLLFEQLWQPGVELVARLIDAARGSLRPDGPADITRTEAMHLISGITTFASGRSAITRFYAEPSSGDVLRDHLHRLIARHVDLIGVAAP
jgi:TetR/AcrR family transcriptional regulator, regulator of cefoperazone and chloramphenicol sensitivity